MSIFKKQPNALDMEIARIEGELAKATPGTGAYDSLRLTLEKLEEIRSKRKTDPKVKAAIVTGVGSVLGIGLIALIENNGMVFRSKGFSLLPKGRG